MSKRTIIFLALFTLLAFGGGGTVLLTYSRKVSVMQFMEGHLNLGYQVIIGVVFGVITAKAGWSIVQLPFLSKTKEFFSGLIQPLKLTILEIIFISLCAGFGEELLFRGAIQPWLGIWFTAILFVLLHGYLNPFNLPMSTYGIYMTLVIGVMGLMTEYFGIITAITSHFVIDLILLKNLSSSHIPSNHDREHIM